jgi:hypothetical protein
MEWPLALFPRKSRLTESIYIPERPHLSTGEAVRGIFLTSLHLGETLYLYLARDSSGRVYQSSWNETSRNEEIFSLGNTDSRSEFVIF